MEICGKVDVNFGGVQNFYITHWNFYITLIPILLELSATLAYGGLRRGWDSNPR